ncbi:hypothetical protein JW859_04895 [bacterium]|nr:hypothetical protein [bacterium]
MRVLTVAIVCLAALVWSGTALAADDFKIHKRTVEFQVVEPCNVLAMEGSVDLEWNDCEGAYALFTSEVEGYPHPLTVLVFIGNPDWSTLDSHVYQSFFCNHCCTKKRPDVYCMDCDPCEWYCYRTKAEWCCDVVCVYAFLPTCMALDVVDFY